MIRVLIGFAAMAFSAAQTNTAEAAKTKSSISGIVQDSVTGAPIADADVYASTASSSNTREMSTTTGSDGRYTFKDLDAGQYRISVQTFLGTSRGFGPSAIKLVAV